MNKPNSDNELIARSMLKYRGWTETMMRKFLPEPDETRENPHYKSAPPMKLYLLKTIEKIERRKTFKATLDKAEKRRAAAKTATETKRKATLRKAEDMTINIPKMTLQQLYERACRHYNDLQMDRGNYEAMEADPKTSDKQFLNRIATNYLRHQCTNYDEQLYDMQGNVGNDEAHDILQERINSEILKTYPELTYTKCTDREMWIGLWQEMKQEREERLMERYGKRTTKTKTKAKQET